jgi:glutamine amidotransferase
MIRIVDYGVGNIQAFLNLFKRLGIDAARAANPAQLSDATRLILPGVGHFDHAMGKLAESGFRPALESRVLAAKVPIIGVCVGMQMLAAGSDEGLLPGLNWIPGRVRAFSSHPACKGLAMPHMGWNELKPTPGSRLFSRGFADDPQLYFLHSYFFDAESRDDVAAKATYGIEFDAVVSRGNIHGVQCHPEKSHHWGEQILRNFVELQ